MTSRKSPRPSYPPALSPSPVPMELQEMEAAKKRTRAGQGRKGRPSTILAGRLMSQRGKMLLGE